MTRQHILFQSRSSWVCSLFFTCGNVRTRLPESESTLIFLAKHKTLISVVCLFYESFVFLHYARALFMVSSHAALHTYCGMPTGHIMVHPLATTDGGDEHQALRASGQGGTRPHVRGFVHSLGSGPVASWHIYNHSRHHPHSDTLAYAGYSH